MHIQLISRKFRNALRIGILALSAAIFFMPLHAHASSYWQHITIYQISVTQTWADNTEPEAIDAFMSYPGEFILYRTESDSETPFPQSVQIYRAGENCGTAVQAGPVDDRKMRYTVDLEIPFHFTSYDTATRSQSISVYAELFTFSFDAFSLTLENEYHDGGFALFRSNFFYLETIENGTFRESAPSGTPYDFTVAKSRSEQTEWFGRDSITTVTLQFTLTASKRPAGALHLTAGKTVNNGRPDQSYTFQLLDADGNVLQTKQNDADGLIQFDPLSYGPDDVGIEHTYQVVEQAGSDEAVTYDGSVYTVRVTPSQDPEDPSVILADPVITKDGEEVSAISFNNAREEEPEIVFPQIPQTGEPAGPAVWLTALFSAAVLFLGLRKKKLA